MYIPEIPIYVNKNLIFDIYSTVVNGYIESKENVVLDSCDNLQKISLGYRKNIECDMKETDSKDKNISIGNSSSDISDIGSNFENRKGKRIQTREKKIYTTFTIFNHLKTILKNNGLLNYSFDFYKMNAGKFIEIEGSICNTNLLLEIDSIISLIENYDTKTLNKLLPDDPKYQITNFDYIYKQLKTLHDILNKNNTNNIIINCKGFSCLLNVNTNFFLDKNSYMYDTVGCNCKCLAKINKKIDRDEKINLLYKTCMDEFYTSFLLLVKQYLNIIKSYDILIPNVFNYTLSAPAIYATPLAIYY